MATGGEVGGKVDDTLASEELDNLKCQPCQKDGELREAVGLCTDSQEYLCQRCFDGRKIPIEGHQLLDKQYDLANNAEIKQVEYQLSSLLEKSKELATAVQQQSAVFDDSYTNAIEMMEDFRQKMNYVVDKIQTEMRKEAEKMKSTETKRMRIVTEKCKQVDKELQFKMTEIHSFRKSKQNSNLCTEMMKMKNKLRSLGDELKKIDTDQSVNKCTIQFAPNYNSLHTWIERKSFGILSFTGRKERDILADTGTVVKAEHARDINVKTSCDDETCSIYGSAILSNNKLIVCDSNNNRIKLVDVKQGIVVTQLKLSCRPWDIAALDENTAAATLPGHQQVLFVTVGADMTVRAPRALPVGGQCRGIDYRDGKLAVSFLSPYTVKVMDLEGEVIYTISSHKAGREVLNVPYYLAFSPAGTSLYVSNWGIDTCNIVCLNMDGTVTAFYKDRELKHPEKVVTDRRGNIYVCGEGSNNLHQLTPDCKKIRVLLAKVDGLQNPYAVSYSETENRLFVGMEACNVVKVYKTILG